MNEKSRWHVSAFPIFVIALALMVLWLVASVQLNSPRLLERYQDNKIDWTLEILIEDAWSMKRPVLPSPQQVFWDWKKFVFETKITSKRSLVYHAWITLSSTMLGFLFGVLLGIMLAVGIVHNRTLERCLLPWVIASQTIPILAVAPMIIVVLGSIGLTGLIPKSIISAYLAFFPVTIGMVKGLRSPDPLQKDLARTYSASATQIFWKLRWPASTPFLFASLKVAIASSLVGAIVGELPTGARAGLGARLLVGSYYGQTIKIWSALMTAAMLAGLLVFLVGCVEKVVRKIMGDVS